MHDLVDNVALEAQQVGKFASLYAQGKLPLQSKPIEVAHTKDFGYVLPSVVYEGEGEVEVKFRLKNKVVKKTIVAKCNGVVLGKKFVLAGVPGEMLKLSINKNGAVGTIELSVE